MLSRKHKKKIRNRKRTKTNMFADGHYMKNRIKEDYNEAFRKDAGVDLLTKSESAFIRAYLRIIKADGDTETERKRKIHNTNRRT